MNIHIACDKAGEELAKSLVKTYPNYPRLRGFSMSLLEVEEDYPCAVNNLLASINYKRHHDMGLIYGILICRTGIGMSIAANKKEGIRAALCHNKEAATLSRSHNNANVLCLSSNPCPTPINDNRVITIYALDIIFNFYTTDFSQADRHIRRVSMLGR